MIQTMCWFVWFEEKTEEDRDWELMKRNRNKDIKLGQFTARKLEIGISWAFSVSPI